jgi:hypothetical protein
MSDKEKDLARQFARNIEDHERRNDYGGTYEQNKSSLKEVIFYRAFTGASLYLLPSGRKTRSFTRAISRWADS